MGCGGTKYFRPALELRKTWPNPPSSMVRWAGLLTPLIVFLLTTHKFW